MIKTVIKTAYKAFGLTVLSEIALPELPIVQAKNGIYDILVEKEDLTTLWSTQKGKDDYFVINEEFILFRIPDIAIFLIQNGNRILVSPAQNTNEDRLRLYILGTCMGAILIQRKILPLHGSAIAIDGKVYAIVGDSGAGKSTLASAFLNRDYQLLSDDVIPITVNEESIPIVIPAYPQQKLWLESLNHFGMTSTNYQPIVERETKFAVPIQSQFAAQRLPLAGVFELVKTEKEEVEIQPIENLERFYTLYNHTYRNFFLVDSGLMEWHFNTTAKIINKTKLFKISRPLSRFTAYELTDLILTTLNMEEKAHE